MRVVDLFAGVGGWSEGARQAGHTVVAAVERDQTAATWYAKNHGDHVSHYDILDVGVSSLLDCDILLASPPCPNFSIAKAGGEETEQDIALASKVAWFIENLLPKYVFIENVFQYRKSRSWSIIEEKLHGLGYWTQLHHLNAANFGVPQTRRRLIVRAVRNGFLPPLPPKVRPWVGWYEAIEDILDELPESHFADWQLARLPEDFEEFLIGAGTYTFPRSSGEPAQTITSNHNQLASVKAFLVGGGNKGAYRGEGKLVIKDPEQPSPTVVAGADRAPIRVFLLGGGNTNFQEAKPGRGVLKPDQPAHTVAADQGKSRAFLVSSQNGSNGTKALLRISDEPSPTVTASRTSALSRAWLAKGRVVSMTPHALARFQSFPDCYQFPETPSHATRLIGNAVPPKLAKALLEGLS